VARLAADSKDTYLIPSSADNRHGERSAPLSRRFRRLRDALGFTPGHVFHSIRKTVATQLEDAQCSEGIAADILGHDKPPP
jgi:integrase